MRAKVYCAKEFSMKVFIFFITTLCLANFSTLYAEDIKINDPRLTCKYFDSLSSDLKICSAVNRGRMLHIQNKAPTTHLYTASAKAMESGAYREDWRQSEYYSKGNMSFGAWMVDLNKDGVEEAIVIPGTSDFCGASGNGDIFVLKRSSDKDSKDWTLIGVLGGNALHIESQRTNNYFDVIVHWHMSAFDGYLTRCKMSEKTGKYEMGTGREYRCTIESQRACF